MTKIATMYLTVLAAGLAAFVFCSYWVYFYVDLNHETNEEEGNIRDDAFGFGIAEETSVDVSFAGREPSSMAAFRQSMDPVGTRDIPVHGPWRKGSV
jgi:hypothetical protein